MNGAPLPSPCRRCGEPTVPVPSGRWTLHVTLCPACLGEDARLRQVAAARRNGATLLNDAGVPTRYRQWTFDRRLNQGKGESWADFTARVRASSPPHLGITRYNAAAAKLLHAVRDDRESVYVCGHVGGGKSTLAAAGIRRLCEAGVSVQYLTESTLWGLGWDPDEIRRLAEVPVLFWDDFSATAEPKPWQVDRVEALITRRYDRRGLTVFTSNEARGTAGEKWGARVASRLAEMVGEREVAIIDHDWRTGQGYGEAASHA